MLQSIHLISASSCARPRLVTRLKTLLAQFWTVMYWIFAPLQRDEFDDGAVQRRGLELRRGAALHVHDLGAFVGDDERALELAEVFRVDAEVGLQRVLHLHARRHVDERAAGEDGAVERGELVVAGRDDLAEPLSEDLRVLAQALGGADEDDALLADGLLDVRVGGLGVELRLDAGEELALLLGNAEALEGPLDVVGHLVPRALRASGLARGNSGSCRN